MLYARSFCLVYFICKGLIVHVYIGVLGFAEFGFSLVVVRVLSISVLNLVCNCYRLVEFNIYSCDVRFGYLPFEVIDLRLLFVMVGFWQCRFASSLHVSVFDLDVFFYCDLR